MKITQLMKYYPGDRLIDPTGEIEIEIISPCELSLECAKVRIIRCSPDMAEVFEVEEGEEVEHFGYLGNPFYFTKLGPMRIN